MTNIISDLEDEMRKYEITCPMRKFDELCKPETKSRYCQFCDGPLEFLACPYHRGMTEVIKQDQREKKAEWK